MSDTQLLPSVRQLQKIPPYVYLAVAVGVGLATLVWHRYCCDPEDTNWLDPGQPPISVPVDFTTTLAGASMVTPSSMDCGTQRPMKKYPWGSLMAHPCCWVGDC